MSGKIKNCKPPFYVYKVREFDYIGLTTNLRKRCLKHKSTRGLGYLPTLDIIGVFDKYEDAIKFEESSQELMGFEQRRVLNQSGENNHMSKEVLDLETGIAFDTIKDACDSLNIVYGSARTWISKKDDFRLIKIQ